MKYKIETTAKAEADRDACFDFIAGKDEAGALRWLEAYQEAANSLKMNPHRGLAPESERHDEEIRERVFKTRHGLPYRLLFIIRDETVHIIHIRGPGQDLMKPEEIESPGGEN